MSKKSQNAIPDFSRKRPADATKPGAASAKVAVPDPRQPQRPPTKSKNGGRRGT